MALLKRDDLSGDLIDGTAYKLQITNFLEKGKFAKAELDIGHDTLMKIVGTTTKLTWKTMVQEQDGKWYEQ